MNVRTFVRISGRRPWSGYPSRPRPAACGTGRPRASSRSRRPVRHRPGGRPGLPGPGAPRRGRRTGPPHPRRWPPTARGTPSTGWRRRLPWTAGDGLPACGETVAPPPQAAVSRLTASTSARAGWFMRFPRFAWRVSRRIVPASAEAPGDTWTGPAVPAGPRSILPAVGPAATTGPAERAVRSGLADGIDSRVLPWHDGGTDLMAEETAPASGRSCRGVPRWHRRRRHTARRVVPRSPSGRRSATSSSRASRPWIRPSRPTPPSRCGSRAAARPRGSPAARSWPRRPQGDRSGWQRSVASPRLRRPNTWAPRGAPGAAIDANDVGRPSEAVLQAVKRLDDEAAAATAPKTGAGAQLVVGGSAEDDATGAEKNTARDPADPAT